MPGRERSHRGEHPRLLASLTLVAGDADLAGEAVDEAPARARPIYRRAHPALRLLATGWTPPSSRTTTTGPNSAASCTSPFQHSARARTSWRDWADVTGDHSHNGTTSGDYRVTGTWDGARLTLSEAPGPGGPVGSSETRDLTTPCPEPSGGWGPVDPATTTDDSLTAALDGARARRVVGEPDRWQPVRLARYGGDGAGWESPNRRALFTVVACSTASTATPLAAATAAPTRGSQAGELGLPRWGTGAR